MNDRVLSEVQSHRVEPSKRLLIGRVISNKMQKTVTVIVERKVRHPLYKKYIRRSTKVHAHDETGDCNIGDWVAIEHCRPLSKTKSSSEAHYTLTLQQESHPTLVWDITLR